jgi:hypothetical protein
MSVPTAQLPSDLDTPGRRDQGLGLIIARFALLAAPVLLFAGYALHPDLPPEAADALPEVADQRGITLASKLLVATGSLLMIPLILRVRRLASDRGRVAATAGAALVTLGMASNALSQATYGYLLWWVTDPEVSRDSGLQVADAATTASLATLPVSFLAMPVFVGGLLLVAAGLWRARSGPQWVPVALAVGTILAAAFPVGLPMVVVGIPITAAFAWMLRTAPAPGALVVAS